MPIEVNTQNQTIEVSTSGQTVSATVSGGQGPQGPAGGAGVATVSAPLVNAGTAGAAALSISIGDGLNVVDGELAADYTGPTFTAAVVAAAPPTTNASLLTSGTLPDSRLSLNIARTSDVSSALDGKAGVSHTHDAAAISVTWQAGNNPSHFSGANVRDVLYSIDGQFENFADSAHTHGNITNDGRIGTASDQIVVTGAGGELTAINAIGAEQITVVDFGGVNFDTSTNNIADMLMGIDGALSNKAAASHTHGNLTNDGRIGTTPGQIVVTTTGGVLTTAATISASSVSGLATVATSGSAADLTGTLSASRLPTSGVTAGTYTSVTVDATGRVTAGSSPAGYTLPTATASVLGGVKIGSGISIDGNGVISASSGYTLPNATTSTLGGVIVGSGLSVISGTVSANVTSVAGRTGAVTIAAGDVSGLAASATTDTTNAGNISSGTLAIGRIPTGTTSSTVCIGNDSRLSDTRTPTDGSVTDAKITSGGLSTGVLNWSAIAPWAANTAYAKGDLVSFQGIAYRRSSAGSSSGSFVATNWQQITPSEFVASQITSGTIATARLGSGTADATTFLRGDQTYAAPFTYATTTQAFTGTSTTVVMNPARVRDWAKNWKLIVLDQVQRDITNTSSTGAFSTDNLRLRANNAFTTANATSVYRSWAPQFAQQYSTSDGNAGSFTNWGWSKGISFAARIAAGPTFSATGTARLQFGKRTASTTGQLDQQGIGVEVRGTTGNGNPRLWILAHNGTSLTQTDTGLNLTLGKIYDLVLSSDAAGTVTALVNDTAYTSSGGPTTDLLSPSNDSTIAIEAGNGSTSSVECSWYVSRHVWVATQ